MDWYSRVFRACKNCPTADCCCKNEYIFFLDIPSFLSFEKLNSWPAVSTTPSFSIFFLKCFSRIPMDVSSFPLSVVVGSILVNDVVVVLVCNVRDGK